MWNNFACMFSLLNFISLINRTFATTKREIAMVHRLLGSDQYDARLRPHFPWGKTTIELGFTVLTIEDLQIEDMGFSMEIFLMQTWYDPRLRHNHTPHLDGSNFEDKIWMPDTYFRESKIMKRRQFEEKKLLIRIYPNGRVYYSTKASLRLSCTMNLKRFPMDVQECFITIESYGYNESEVIYKWQNSSRWTYKFRNKNLSHYNINPMDRMVVTSSYTYGQWSSLKAKITFKRKSSAFIPAMYFPCTVIVIISWITFFIHPNHFPARTNLCAISILTILTMQGTINNTLPKVSYVKVIDTYVMACVMFVSGAFAEYALVLLIKHKRKVKAVQREKKRMDKIMSTGGADMYRDDPKADVIQKAKNRAWKNFYMTDSWPLVLDNYSRLLFPLAFIVFNSIYWVMNSMHSGALAPKNS